MSPVKTHDLCERCKYHYNRWCQDRCLDCYCFGCEHFGEDGNCLCLTIEKNTPCPYFEEANGDEAMQQ